MNNMDEAGGHHPEGNKPDTERKEPHDLTYVWKEKVELYRSKEANGGGQGQGDGATGRHWSMGRKLQFLGL